MTLKYIILKEFNAIYKYTFQKIWTNQLVDVCTTNIIFISNEFQSKVVFEQVLLTWRKSLLDISEFNFHKYTQIIFIQKINMSLHSITGITSTYLEILRGSTWK